MIIKLAACPKSVRANKLRTEKHKVNQKLDEIPKINNCASQTNVIKRQGARNSCSDASTSMQPGKFPLHHLACLLDKIVAPYGS